MNRLPWWTRGLPDGSRVNAAIPPVAVDGPLLSIRRFGRNPLMAGGSGRQSDHDRPGCWSSWKPA